MLNEDDTLIMPGDLGFGNRNDSFTTLLGSCIAVTLWHPLLKVGGMCHFVLPSSGQKNAGTMNPRYGDDAIRMLREKVRNTRTNPQDYVTGVYGGSIMLRNRAGACTNKDTLGNKMCSGCSNVSCRNQQAAYAGLSEHGFKIDHADVGGSFYRQIRLRLSDGSVTLSSGVMPSFEPVEPPRKYLG